MAINNVTLAGNLTRDPELRQTQGGMAVLNMGIAVNDRVKKGDEWEDYANFINLVMFGKRAENVSKFLSKGSKIAVEGKLHYSSWQDKDGSNRSKIEVIVNDLELMSKGQDAQPVQAEIIEPIIEVDTYDEDVPF